MCTFSRVCHSYAYISWGCVSHFGQNLSVRFWKPPIHTCCTHCCCKNIFNVFSHGSVNVWVVSGTWLTSTFSLWWTYVTAFGEETIWVRRIPKHIRLIMRNIELMCTFLVTLPTYATITFELSVMHSRAVRQHTCAVFYVSHLLFRQLALYILRYDLLFFTDTRRHTHMPRVLSWWHTG